MEKLLPNVIQNTLQKQASYVKWIFRVYIPIKETSLLS